MASACVNNIAMSSENFLDCPPAKFSPCGWSPIVSFTREFPDADGAASSVKASSPSKAVEVGETDLEASDKDLVDFEFRLEDPVSMLPADELFYEGKLVPLSTARPVSVTPSPKQSRRDEIPVTDPYLFSPKAPRCSSRWKELLGLKKLYQNSLSSNNAAAAAYSKAESSQCLKTTSSAATKSLKNFLHRCSKSSAPSGDGLHLPLLKDATDNDSVSLTSSRLSLSSSSSGHEHDDLPRLSLDGDKPSSTAAPSLHRVTAHRHRVRVVKARSSSLSSENPTAGVRVGRSPIRRQPETLTSRGVSMDSPRMNSSGKIVFHSLERSSSSPSSFNGGPSKYNKHRAMERSYSANVVRVTPVLNVAVCSSLRGGSSKSTGVFGLPLFPTSQPKKDGGYHQLSSSNRK